MTMSVASVTISMTISTVSMVSMVTSLSLGFSLAMMAIHSFCNHIHDHIHGVHGIHGDQPQPRPQLRPLSCHNDLHSHGQDHNLHNYIQDHNLHNRNHHSIRVRQKHQPQLQQLARHLSCHSDHDVHGFCNHRFCNHGFCNHVHDDQGRPGPHPPGGLNSPKVSCYQQ